MAWCVAPLLAACGGGSDPEPTPTPSATVAPIETPTPAGPATLAPVVWAERIDSGTNAPTEAVDQFTTEASTIYAVVPATNLASGAIVSATWTYNGTSLDSAAQSVTLTEALREGYIEFHLTRSPDQPWPDGNYAIEVAVSGEVMQRAEVLVADT